MSLTQRGPSCTLTTSLETVDSGWPQEVSSNSEHRATYILLVSALQTYNNDQVKLVSVAGIDISDV